MRTAQLASSLMWGERGTEVEKGGAPTPDSPAVPSELPSVMALNSSSIDDIPRCRLEGGESGRGPGLMRTSVDCGRAGTLGDQSGRLSGVVWRYWRG